jgi:putative membrane protein
VIIIGSVLIGLAALLHVYFFVLESVLWTREKTWRIFGVRSQQDAETTRGLAYNQGFYNLFLAIGAITGIILYWAGLQEAGLALMYLTAGSMVAAAIVVVTGGAKFLRASLIQGVLPLLGIVALLLS